MIMQIIRVKIYKKINPTENLLIYGKVTEEIKKT